MSTLTGPTFLGKAGITASANTITITLSAGAAIGDTVNVGVLINDNTKTISSVTDTGGNTYTVGASYADGSSTERVGGAYSRLTTALSSGNTIVVHLSGNVNRGAAIAVSIGGVSAANPGVDKEVTATGATGTAMTGASTGTLSASDEMVLSWFGYTDANSSTSSGFSNTGSGTWDGTGNGEELLGAATVNRGISLIHQVVSATTAISHSASHTASAAWAVRTVTFRGGAPVQNVTGVGGIASAESFGTLQVNQQVLPTAIPTGVSFGTLQVNLNVAPTAIATGVTFGTLKVNQQVRITAIASGELFGAGMQVGTYGRGSRVARPSTAYAGATTVTGPVTITDVYFTANMAFSGSGIVLKRCEFRSTSVPTFTDCPDLFVEDVYFSAAGSTSAPVVLVGTLSGSGTGGTLRYVTIDAYVNTGPMHQGKINTVTWEHSLMRANPSPVANNQTIGPLGNILPPQAFPVAPVTPTPPQAYTVPGGAISVATTAALRTQLAATPAHDIVLENGTYDDTTYLIPAAAHRLWARTLGGAVMKIGVEYGNRANAEVHGLAFDISDPLKVFRIADGADVTACVYNWGTSTGMKVLDCTFNGHGVIAAGVFATNPDGLVVQRCAASNMTDYGFFGSFGDRTRGVTTPMTLSDLDASHIKRATPGSSNGTAEFGVWIGNAAGTVQRVRVRDCAAGGIWTGANAIDTTIQDVDVDACRNALYVEHVTQRVTFKRARLGPQIGVGLVCEWDGGTGDISNFDCTLQDAFIDCQGTSDQGHSVGVWLGAGSTRFTITNVVFRNQNFAGIADLAGNGTTTIGPCDYSGIAASAVKVTHSDPGNAGNATSFGTPTQMPPPQVGWVRVKGGTTIDMRSGFPEPTVPDTSAVHGPVVVRQVVGGGGTPFPPARGPEHWTTDFRYAGPMFGLEAGLPSRTLFTAPTGSGTHADSFGGVYVDSTNINNGTQSPFVWNGSRVLPNGQVGAWECINKRLYNLQVTGLGVGPTTGQGLTGGLMPIWLENVEVVNTNPPGTIAGMTTTGHLDLNLCTGGFKNVRLYFPTGGKGSTRDAEGVLKGAAFAFSGLVNFKGTHLQIEENLYDAIKCGSAGGTAHSINVEFQNGSIGRSSLTQGSGHIDGFQVWDCDNTAIKRPLAKNFYMCSGGNSCWFMNEAGAGGTGFVRYAVADQCVFHYGNKAADLAGCHQSGITNSYFGFAGAAYRLSFNAATYPAHGIDTSFTPARLVYPTPQDNIYDGQIVDGSASGNAALDGPVMLKNPRVVTPLLSAVDLYTVGGSPLHVTGSVAGWTITFEFPDYSLSTPEDFGSGDPTHPYPEQPVFCNNFRVDSAGAYHAVAQSSNPGGAHYPCPWP